MPKTVPSIDPMQFSSLSLLSLVGLFLSTVGWVRGGGFYRGSMRRGRDALIELVGRACEKGDADWPVTRSHPVVRERERPLTG